MTEAGGQAGERRRGWAGAPHLTSREFDPEGESSHIQLPGFVCVQQLCHELYRRNTPSSEPRLLHADLL